MNSSLCTSEVSLLSLSRGTCPLVADSGTWSLVAVSGAWSLVADSGTWSLVAGSGVVWFLFARRRFRLV